MIITRIDIHQQTNGQPAADRPPEVRVQPKEQAADKIKDEQIDDGGQHHQQQKGRRHLPAINNQRNQRAGEQVHGGINPRIQQQKQLIADHLADARSVADDVLRIVVVQYCLDENKYRNEHPLQAQIIIVRIRRLRDHGDKARERQPADGAVMQQQKIGSEKNADQPIA